MAKETGGTVADGAAGNPAPARPVKPAVWDGLAVILRSLLAATLYRDTWLVNGLAFLLSRVSLMGELAPFGLAFFAAVAQVARRRAAGAAVWALLGVLSVERYAEAGVYLFAILLYLRLVDKLSRPEQKLQTVPLFVFAAVVLGGAPLVLWQGATPYQVLSVVFDALICMVLAYIFMSGMRLLVTRQSPRPVTNEMLMCLAIVLAAAVAGVGPATVAGFSLRNIAGDFTVMALSLVGGAGLGTSLGVVVGLTVGLADNNAITLLSLYSIAGLLSGAFRSLGKFAVALGFMLGSVITVLHFGRSADLMGVLAEASVAAVFFMAVPLNWFRQWSANFQENKSEQAQVAPVIGAAVKKMTVVAEVFGSLAAASATAAAGAGGKIREMETARMLSAVGGQVCGPCPRRTGCWDYDFYRTHEAMVDALALAEQTTLAAGGLPKLLREGCLHSNEVVKTINSVAQYNRTCSFWQKKFAATRQTLTEQLQALSGIIVSLAGALGQEPLNAESLAAALKERAALAGCPLADVKVDFRNRAIIVEASKPRCLGNQECVNTILPLAAKLLGRKLTLKTECAEKDSDKNCRLLLEVTDSFRVETGAASVAKESQGVCGDTYAVFPVAREKTALIISDGMGSGSQAAGESSVTVEYLEKLLTAGFAADVAVKTVNDMLLLKEPEESFATLDIALIDTYAGEAEFLKVGSAPSYIKRVHEVATIRSAALPVGILQHIEIEPVKWLLAPGDVIVMVSDGIIDIPGRGTDREPWLVNFLRRSTETGPQEMADMILRQAMELAPGGIRDDMTVLVAQISQRTGAEQ